MGAMHQSTRGVLLAAFVFAGVVAGCDNSIEPFKESTRYYALFGFLDADRDTQYVRIEPTRSNPELGPVVYDVASVKTTDLGSGEVVVWSDSTVILDDGREGLLYYGMFRPLRNHSYRIEVRRDDGATTTAVTKVPLAPPLSVRRPDRSFLGALEQGLLFDGVRRAPEKIVVNYAVTFDDLETPVQVKLPYNVVGVPEGSGWRVIVRLTRDKSTVLERLSLTTHDPVALHTLSIDLRLLSEDWPLDQPGLTQTNVTNGFGFFGSAVTHTATWVLDSSYVNELGLIDAQEHDTGADGK